MVSCYCVPRDLQRRRVIHVFESCLEAFFAVQAICVAVADARSCAATRFAGVLQGMATKTLVSGLVLGNSCSLGSGVWCDFMRRFGLAVPVSYIEIIPEGEDMVRFNLLRDDPHALGGGILARRVVAPVLQRAAVASSSCHHSRAAGDSCAPHQRIRSTAPSSISGCLTPMARKL